MSGDDVCQFLCRLVIFKRHPHPRQPDAPFVVVVVRFISFIAIALASKKKKPRAEKEAGSKKNKRKMAENEVNESPRWFFYALIIDIIPLLPSSPGL